MTNAVVGFVGIIFIIIQFISENKIKNKNPDSEKISNYYGFSKHRQFLMGIAALGIVVFHSVSYCELQTDNRIINYLFGFTYNLNIGVEIFLLLSGIGLYFSFNNKKVNFKEYYIKRILNVYLIALIIDLPYVIYADLIFENKGILYALAEWIGLLNWTGKTKLAWYAIFAMFLYAIYPLIFKVLKSIEKSKYELLFVTAFCVAWALLCKGVNILFPQVYSAVEIAINRIPVFIIGCYLGRFVYNREKYSAKLYFFALFGIVLWVILSVFNCGLIGDRFGHCLLSLALCIVILKLTDLIKIKPLYKFFEFLGGMSLELYLVHLIFAYSIFELNGNKSVLLYYFFAIVSVFISYFVSKFRKLIVKKYTARLSSGVK